MCHWHLLGGGGLYTELPTVYTVNPRPSLRRSFVFVSVPSMWCTVDVVLTRKEEEWNEERERRPFALDLMQQRWWRRRRSFIPFIFNNDEEKKKKTKWTGGGDGDGGGGACVRACCCSLLAGYQLHTVCQ